MTSDALASLLAFAESTAARIDAGAVSAKVAPAALRRRLVERLDPAEPHAPLAVLAEVEDLMRRFSVHVTHPRYFGLYNPSVLPEAVAAAALTAAYNPQCAVWSHAPAVAEMERHALAWLAARVGWEPGGISAHFTSGGQEANLSAVTVALAAAFPRWREHGLRALPADPVLYVSGEGHHSFVKAARVCGLGDAAVRWVPVDARLRMDVAALREAIAADRAASRAPFLVVGTAGTTAAGVVDPLPQLADLCTAERLWFHCDAAWGGGALLSPRLRTRLAGVERADSVTWDAHKWLSCPMGTGALLCRRPDAVRTAFEVGSGYMPPPREGSDDPHRVSLQWSRRAAGVPVLAALATRGAAGFAALVERQADTGERLRELVRAAGYRVVNDTPLPVICFTRDDVADATDVARAVVARGRAWLSPVSLAGGPRVLRACITSYRTTDADLAVLVDEVEAAVATHRPGRGA